MAIRIKEPAHYRLIKACAQKSQLRSAAKKGKAYRRLTETELDDIASGATVYFVEYQRSSRIQTPHQQCNCEACLDQLQLRAVVSAYAAARRARADYVREKLCDGKHVNATDTDEFDELWETEIPKPRADMDVMLSALKDDRQRRLAELLANQADLEQITQDVGYKTWSAVTYAKKQIAKRLADYQPAVVARTRLPDDAIESPIVRAIRVAIISAIREGTPTIVKERATIRVAKTYYSAPWSKLPAPRRAKSTRPVDTAIPAQPGEFRPMPELWARHIGLGQGRGNITPTIPEQTQDNPPTTYWSSPIIAQLENARYQQWLTIFAR